MKKLAGLWVNHSRAVIVVIKNGVEVTHEVVSHLEENGRLPIVSHSMPTASTDRLMLEIEPNKQYSVLLNRYYEKIIFIISDADSIWIFGPGDPKAELENRLKLKGFGARIVGIESVEKMNDQKITAIVREHFLRKRNAWEFSQDMKNT